MSYRAPVADIAFALKHGAGMDEALAQGLYGDLGTGDIGAVLAEAGRFASDILSPLNVVGDRHGAVLKDGKVVMPPGWKEAYAAWAAAGWNGLSSPAAWGGQGLPRALRRDVECRRDVLRARPDPDHGRDRCAGSAWQ
jgi:butyryl-CoA dehydrogenase